MRYIYGDTINVYGNTVNGTKPLEKDEVRFIHHDGFGDDTVYVVGNKWSGMCYAVTKQGMQSPCPDLEIEQCYRFVSNGVWKELVKNE